MILGEKVIADGEDGYIDAAVMAYVPGDRHRGAYRRLGERTP
jgi:hypothetical protein